MKRAFLIGTWPGLGELYNVLTPQGGYTTIVLKPGQSLEERVAEVEKIFSKPETLDRGLKAAIFHGWEGRKS